MMAALVGGPRSQCLVKVKRSLSDCPTGLRSSPTRKYPPILKNLLDLTTYLLGFLVGRLFIFQVGGLKEHLVFVSLHSLAAPSRVLQLAVAAVSHDCQCIIILRGLE